MGRERALKRPGGGFCGDEIMLEQPEALERIASFPSLTFSLVIAVN